MSSKDREDARTDLDADCPSSVCHNTHIVSVNNAAMYRVVSRKSIQSARRTFLGGKHYRSVHNNCMLSAATLMFKILTYLPLRPVELKTSISSIHESVFTPWAAVPGPSISTPKTGSISLAGPKL